jgi:hypothetical protein
MTHVYKGIGYFLPKATMCEENARYLTLKCVTYKTNNSERVTVCTDTEV